MLKFVASTGSGGSDNVYYVSLILVMAGNTALVCLWT